MLPRVWSRLVFNVNMEFCIFLEAMQRNSENLHIETEVVLIVPVKLKFNSCRVILVHFV